MAIIQKAQQKQKEQMELCALSASIFVASICEDENEKKKKERRFWVREMFQDRSDKGFFSDFYHKLKFNDPELFKNFVRMDATDFDFLLQKVAPRIAKKDTYMRQAISPAERLAVHMFTIFGIRRQFGKLIILISNFKGTPFTDNRRGLRCNLFGIKKRIYEGN